MPTYKPVKQYLVKSHFVIIGSLVGRGGKFIRFGDGGLKPSAVAGGPSVTRFTHNKCIAVNGSGKPRSVAKNIAHSQK